MRKLVAARQAFVQWMGAAAVVVVVLRVDIADAEAGAAGAGWNTLAHSASHCLSQNNSTLTRSSIGARYMNTV